MLRPTQRILFASFAMMLFSTLSFQTVLAARDEHDGDRDRDRTSVGVPGPQGPIGPQGPAGPQGAQGPAGAPGFNNIFVNRNCFHVPNGCGGMPLAPFPGVKAASLSLPPGEYVIVAKFRYQNDSGSGPNVNASCVYQSAAGIIGGLDASSGNAPPGGEATGQVDGFMMDIFINDTGAPTEVHVQCFGPPTASIVNTQFVAFPGTVLIQ